MKKLSIFIIICLSSAQLFAQQNSKTFTLKGFVADSVTRQAMPFVTVAVADALTHKPVKSIVTRQNGYFEITELPPAATELSLMYLGYKSKTMAIVASGLVANMGLLLLVPVASDLKEVKIRATKPLMKQEAGRISYDVQADQDNKALSALDMMRKLPFIAVDAQDHIKLKGSDSYKILINGKESGMMVKNPSDVLKAMPAINIEKIEVITTPPAKYDAEGLAGIINIITKKNIDEGYNVAINVKENDVWGPGGHISGSFKQGKLGFTTYVENAEQPYTKTFSGLTQQILNSQSTIVQAGEGRYGSRGTFATAEISYEADTLNLLTASFEFYAGKFYGYNNQQFDNYNITGVDISSYSLANNSLGVQRNFSAGLNYELGFKKKKDQLLTLSYKFNYAPETANADNVFDNRFNYAATDYPDYRHINNTGSKEHTLQLDYAQPFKKLTVEAGAKAIMRNSYSNFERDNADADSKVYVIDSSQSNNFNYLQNVYSLYNSYQLKLDNWTAKTGLRLEQTTVNAFFASVSARVRQMYNNFIPSVVVMRSFKNSNISLGYTQRIQRPNIYKLNPFVDRTDPKFVTVGNPELHPEVNHTFELSYSNLSKNSFTAGLSYAFSDNAIQTVSSLGTDTINGQPTPVTITSYQNLGTNNTLGLNANASFPLGDKANISINGQLNHVWLAGYLDGQFYKNNGYIGNAFISGGYNMGKGYRLNIDTGYFSGAVNLQGGSTDYYYSAFSIVKDLMNKKASIVLACNDPWLKYKTYYTTINSANFDETSFNSWNYRSFVVRFNYKFGKLKSEIKRNKHGITNDDTKSGSKN